MQVHLDYLHKTAFRTQHEQYKWTASGNQMHPADSHHLQAVIFSDLLEMSPWSCINSKKILAVNALSTSLDQEKGLPWIIILQGNKHFAPH